MTIEIIVNTVEALVVFGFGFIVGKKALRRQHAELDAEHGITHN